ncbi:MAG: hypothetical protein ABT940_00460 [Alphaproteobacteria bacterium]
MSDGTVRRYTLQEPTKYIEGGAFVIPAGIAMVKASDFDTLRTQARELARALARLSNEVIGSLPLGEATIRHAIGNTNYNCLIERATEARAVLAKAQAVLKEGR